MTKLTCFSGWRRKRTRLASWASSSSSPLRQSHSPSSRLRRAPEMTFSSMDSEQIRLMHQLFELGQALLFRGPQPVDEPGQVRFQRLRRDAQRPGEAFRDLEPFALGQAERAAQGRLERLLLLSRRVPADRPDREDKGQVLPEPPLEGQVDLKRIALVLRLELQRRIADQQQRVGLA